jgi:drug/metabolite transporter (DMT)-like permease
MGGQGMPEDQTAGRGPNSGRTRSPSPLVRRVILPDFIVVSLAPIAENVTYKLATQGRQTWLFQDLGYMLGAGLLIVITFYGIWIHQRDDRKLPPAEAMRDAITATVILLYLVLVSWATFFAPGPTRDLLPDQLLASLTTVTGIVIAFYFISTAAASKWSPRPPWAGEPADQEPAATENEQR